MYFPAKQYRDLTPPQVSLKNVPQEYVGHYKYIGVHLDSKLNFQTHLNQVYKLASHKIYLLCKIRNLLTEHAALTIYRYKILPYFDYGDILYHRLSASANNADRLQKLQNRALRICLKAEARTPISNLHNRAKLPFLKHRRISHIRNLAYKRSRKEQYKLPE